MTNQAPPPAFVRGDRVRRAKGSYTFPGVVLGSFVTTLGLRLYAVEHRAERGLVHVFREADIKADGPAEATP